MNKRFGHFQSVLISVVHIMGHIFEEACFESRCRLKVDIGCPTWVLTMHLGLGGAFI